MGSDAGARLRRHQGGLGTLLTRVQRANTLPATRAARPQWHAQRAPLLDFIFYFLLFRSLFRRHSRWRAPSLIRSCRTLYLGFLSFFSFLPSCSTLVRTRQAQQAGKKKKKKMRRTSFFSSSELSLSFFLSSSSLRCCGLKSKSKARTHKTN